MVRSIAEVYRSTFIIPRTPQTKRLTSLKTLDARFYRELLNHRRDENNVLSLAFDVNCSCLRAESGIAK